VTNPLDGRVAVITGGASGIGEACAQDLDEARAQATAAGLPGAIAIRLDVTDADATEAAAAEVERALGPADILVTSAGILQRPLPPEELPLAEWDRVIAVDQRGVYVSCVAFGRRMATRGAGSIVNIASIAGMRSMPLHAYAPAKAAVIGITLSLAGEWGRSGVRVNAIAPGFVMTPALQAAVRAGQRDPGKLADAAALGRLVRAEEIANACVFLASDAASAITGVTLPVDAGWLLAGSWQGYGGLPPPRTL
jgi:NAD(P)-dependent dehydrogenase (short-subunit alcohol dehydrogenase family)